MITLLWACLRLPRQVLGFIASALAGGNAGARPAPIFAPRLELVPNEPIDPVMAASATEPVAFSLDGTSYEVDLSSEEADALRRQLHPYVTAARRASRRG